MKGAARRVTLEVVGWFLVVAGVAALILPGPGLLMLFGGLAVLSQQYEWAERRLDPVKYRALKGAAESVETKVRVVFSAGVALVLVAAGVLWIWKPDVPAWWPFADSWWLPGGIATGITQVVSGIVALALLVYSYRRFHGRPDAVAALERDIDRADRQQG
ncbi:MULTISPECIES: PGPGW domain-containing protein [unclassified Nocardioides]|uniref:PGPGW domain-containing protein n=1 Tax=unclassified Nocardioides TaxID=2615069 RepID=UPI0026653DE9|nr:PGPGW domain-containing protein [Nocardioides sp. Arc9.136]WKN48723.1 PGPGW domain-containing protein [Nocardioides sp. Arc9.136]